MEVACVLFAKSFNEHQKEKNELNHLNELCMTSVKQFEMLSDEFYLIQRILADTLLERQKASVAKMVGPFTSTNKKL